MIRLLLAGILLMILMGRRNVSSKIEAWARATMEFEGWFPGSRSVRNNNPGNLKFAGQKGAIGQDDEGHAIFESFEDGWNALIRQLRSAATVGTRVYNPGMTLLDFYRRYAESNSLEYAEFVASQLNVSFDTKIGELV